MSQKVWVRQLFDAETWTYTYLVADPASKEAMLIDPVLEQTERDLQLVKELGFTLRFAADTHVHADHVTGSGRLREHTGCTTVSGPGGAECADQALTGGGSLQLGSLQVQVLATPGHTDDSVSYLVDGHVFTGDALLIRGCGRTDFQNGDAGQLYDAIHGQLFTLPDDTTVWPGHDYQGRSCSTVGEERAHNPRLTRDRDAFIQLMAELGLPAPKHIVRAVAANRACGMTEAENDDLEPGLQRLWTSARPSGNYRDLDVQDLPLPQAGLRIVDVREADEFDGPLGHLEGSERIGPGDLKAACEGWPRTQPVLLVCRSGRRSSMAAQALAAQGFSRVLNLRGGMIAYRQTSQTAQV